MLKFSAIAIFLFFTGGLLFAGDYKWDLINALIRSDFPAIENIISQNINTVPADEKRVIMNFALVYSRGETTLRVLNLLQSYNVNPIRFDLFTAIQRNHGDAVIQFILDSGVAANGEILLLAMERQRFNFAEQFILMGADVNYFYPLSRRNADGMTPLLHASRHNNYEMVRLLVEHGANINAGDINGDTALSLAQSNNNARISDFLIERGANQNADNVPRQPQGGGIAGLFDNHVEFQPGNYRLSGRDRIMNFTGTASFGTVAFINNNRVFSGTYQVIDRYLTITLDGRTFMYRIDSNVSFSGHGETWVRAGN